MSALVDAVTRIKVEGARRSPSEVLAQLQACGDFVGVTVSQVRSLATNPSLGGGVEPGEDVMPAVVMALPASSAPRPSSCTPCELSPSALCLPIVVCAIAGSPQYNMLHGAALEHVV